MATKAIDLVYENVAERISSRQGELMYWETPTIQEANLGRIATDPECHIDEVGLHIPLSGCIRITWNPHSPPSLHNSGARSPRKVEFYRQVPDPTQDPLKAKIGDHEVLRWLAELPIDSAQVIHYAAVQLGKVVDLSGLRGGKQASIKRYARKWVGLNSKHFREIGITSTMFK